MPLLRTLAAVVALTGLAITLPARADTVASAFSPHAKGSARTVDHATWDGLLKSHLGPAEAGLSRVAYAAFKAADHGKLKGYIRMLEATDVATLDRPEQFAFWANLYNARTVDIVLDAHPVKSIKDINLGGGLVGLVKGGPWKANVVRVAGRDLSLDDIEHGILRPVFKDPRVHYAVNCASVGCPNLGPEAFTGARLEAQLDAAARAFVNSPRGFRVTGKKVWASNIYSWFQADFGGNAAGVLDHARRYAEPALKQQLNGITAIAEFGYDWALNDAAR